MRDGIVTKLRWSETERSVVTGLARTHVRRDALRGKETQSPNIGRALVQVKTLFNLMRKTSNSWKK